jgi:LPXTG-motif cell wall-anchored protein
MKITPRRGAQPTTTRQRSGRSWAPALLLLITASVVTLPAGAAGADHEGPEVITVNGQPFHGQGSPKLEGCTLTIAVSDVADDLHDIEVDIALTEPSGDAVLVSDAATFTGTTWEESYPMDDLVAEMEPAEHGYHVLITAVLDGVSQTSRPFWLLCGASAEGNPFRVHFLKQWQTAEAEVLAGPPSTLDRSAYAIDVTSDRGTARCVYPEVGDELACTYQNQHGHEDETEHLIIPAGEHFTFTVTETGLPDGWEPVAGVGTFSPREVCPFDEHEEEAVVRPHEPREPCAFTIVNEGELPPEPTTTTTSAPTSVTTAPASETTAPANVLPADLTSTTSGSTTLPATGADDVGPMAAAGLAALVVGAGTVAWANRRRASI